MAESLLTRSQPCVKCGSAGMPSKGARGPIPLRCEPCQAEYKRHFHSKNWQPAVAEPVRRLTCADCGTGFDGWGRRGKGRARCPQCEAARRLTKQRALAPEKYRRFRIRNRIRTREEALAERRAASKRLAGYTCQGCGAHFVPKAYDRTKYCSKACHGRHRSANKTKWPFSTVSFPTCHHCSNVFATRHTAKFCGSACRAQATSVPIKPRACRTCGVTFTGAWQRHCETCRPAAQAESRRASRRRTKKLHGHKQRDRARKAGVAYEPIDPLKVFDRDGWRCMICGRATPKRLRGTFDERAPELDHRVPIAKGGGHTWDNVQCACRRCNGLKGDKLILGQMDLFPKAA